MTRLTLLVGLALPVSASAEIAPDSVRVQRLAAVGKLWSAVELFHPWVPGRPGAWDSTLVRAIPAIREARSREDYGAAVDSMLASLGDGATRVQWGETAWSPSSKDPDPRWRWEKGDVLVARMNNGTDLLMPDAQARLESLSVQVERAAAVVLDLRRLSSKGAYPPEYPWNVSGMSNALARERVQSPASRSRAHIGWRGPVSTASSYGSHWRMSDGLRFSPTKPGAPIRVVALVNADSWIPPVVFALQAAGTATVIAEGELNESPGLASQIPLGEGLVANVRTGELVMADGSRPRPDTVLAVPANADTGVALRVAIAMASRRSLFPRAKPIAATALPPARPVPDPYATMRSPELPWRMLAAYRIWSRVEYFAAYRHLLADRWDRAFEAAIPSFEAAEDSTAYALAVARFYTHMEDTHGFIQSPALRAWIGAAPPPVRVRQIEGKPVVTSFLDSTAARAAGFEIGDRILAVDGEDAAPRQARLGGVLCASSDSQRDYLSTTSLLQGADSSMAVVRVRDARGRTVERRAPRSFAYFRGRRGDRSGPVWKVLPGNLGYVDLERLAPTQVDSMFTALAGTRGLILDMRGYPQGTAWTIAPRLTERTGVIGATFRTPIAYRPGSNDFRIDEQEIFDQPIPVAQGSRYLEPTVMLVDERTISQAEHSGLFFSAANGTTFVGSQTAGANGDITTFTVPGEIRLTFSGHDVRHADGRQLQQVGLPITVTARPTTAGLHAGRDEVLEAGVRHLEGRIAAAKRKPARRLGSR